MSATESRRRLFTVRLLAALLVVVAVPCARAQPGQSPVTDTDIARAAKGQPTITDKDIDAAQRKYRMPTEEELEIGRAHV